MASATVPATPPVSAGLAWRVVAWKARSPRPGRPRRALDVADQRAAGGGQPVGAARARNRAITAPRAGRREPAGRRRGRRARRRPPVARRPARGSGARGRRDGCSWPPGRACRIVRACPPVTARRRRRAHAGRLGGGDRQDAGVAPRPRTLASTVASASVVHLVDLVDGDDVGGGELRRMSGSTTSSSIGQRGASTIVSTRTVSSSGTWSTTSPRMSPGAARPVGSMRTQSGS